MSDHPNGAASATPKGIDYELGKKRIVVCCDGTWQDAFVSKNPGEYTNIIKLSRMAYHLDHRSPNGIPIPQVIFYQSGIGTDQPLILEYLQGATGSSLREKVQEAYGFICHNYRPGDEIFIFGFSRGAYTARMISFFIGKMGVLDKQDLVYFADIFNWMQDLEHPDKQGKDDRERLEEGHKLFDPIIKRGKEWADRDKDDFTIKVLGVFDTVGSIGLPQELELFPKMKHFGLPEHTLGKHVKHAYHAIAINETRKDFDVVRFEQSEEGLKKGQTLKQVWFSGSHSDIGGGYCGHDLSDITLTWMTANIMDKLALDIEYMKTLFNPNGPWGTQKPHDPLTGIFILALETKRTLPSPSPPSPCFPFFESIHPSVQHQPENRIVPAINELISSNPQIVWDLMPLEEEIKSHWATLVKKLGEKGCEDNRRAAEGADKKKTKVEEVKGMFEGIKNVFLAATGVARRATLRGSDGKKRSRVSWAGTGTAGQPDLGKS